MTYYVAMRKDEILQFAPTWMELEEVMQSKMSYKENYSLIHGVSRNQVKD